MTDDLDQCPTCGCPNVCAEGVHEAADEIERLREILRELANCGYSPHVHGVDWVEVQVDWDEWKALDEFREKPAPEAGW